MSEASTVVQLASKHLYVPEDGPPYPLPSQDGIADDAVSAFIKSQSNLPDFAVDANIIDLPLVSLTHKVQACKSSAFHCSVCGAVLNIISVVKNKTWSCEFCGKQNPLPKGLKAKHLMAHPEIEFVLKPAPKASKKKVEPFILFCVDISGSMGVTQEMEIGPAEDGEDISWSYKKASSTYQGETRHVSRLKFMQRAILGKVKQLAQENPSATVGLVYFNSEVGVVGDGTKLKQVLPETMLYEESVIAEKAIEMEEMLEAPLSAARIPFESQLVSLRSSGQTALGPALMLSINMVSSRPGSKVIVCTDGLSNVGLGAMSQSPSSEEQMSVRAYYTSLGDRARDAGVVVSVISIKGEDCNLQNLGRVTEASGGVALRVEPEELPAAIAGCMSESVLATNVRARLITHSRFIPYQCALPVQPNAGFNCHENMLGAVTAKSHALFQVGLAPTNLLDRLPYPPPEMPAFVPIQVQVEYSAPDQSRRLRVFSIPLQTTSDLNTAIASANAGIVSAYATHSSAYLAQLLLYDEAKRLAMSFEKLLQAMSSASEVAQVVYSSYADNMQSFYDNINQLQQPSGEYAEIQDDVTAGNLLRMRQLDPVYEVADVPYGNTVPNFADHTYEHAEVVAPKRDSDYENAESVLRQLEIDA